VPNHVAIDHPWVFAHPERLVHGDVADLLRQPQNYAQLPTRNGLAIIAHGRDPFFDGWTDTVQLNYRHPALRAAQLAELGRIAERCDGVRCDMAMLLEPSVMTRTWGDRALPVDGTPPRDEPFWPGAIAAVKGSHADFVFLGEVYWDLDLTLQRQGFDFTYDKRLYDALVAGVARPVRDHLSATPAFLERGLRFLENHDETRAALAFAPALHRAAAVVTFLAPGLRLFHDGQLDGRRTHVSMQLRRRAVEPVDANLRAFYDRLLAVLARPVAHGGPHGGRWTLWPCREAWPGNPTHDAFLVSTWDHGEDLLLVVVNFSATRAQCKVPLALPALRGRRWLLVDQLTDATYDRDGDTLTTDGLYLDLPPWGYHAFVVAAVA
jgi:hypothetical protein